MAPSIAYTRASATLTLSSNPSVLRCLTSSTSKKHRIVPARTLWWWSRHGTWSSANDENVEERIQRHQKIMRHRFSRALRRRAMWDREDNGSSWLWQNSDARVGRRWGACRTMSSTDPLKVRLDDKRDGLSSPEEFWSKTQKDFEKFDKNFESFKAAIDRAIEKDPYGTLFGRRLQSPPSENNSSWISWLFNRGEQKQQPSIQSTEPLDKRKIPIEVLDKEPSAAKSRQVSSQPTKTTSKHTSGPVAATEYVYDPVSGRKVPQSSLQSSSATQSAQTFLETLFSEHGASPDKPVKQSKIYGHEPNDKKSSMKLQDESDKTTTETKSFESSRKRQYQQLRATILGNSIDTTAEFGGKYEQPSVDEEPVEPRARRPPEPAEDAPLFSGTAYASKAEDILQDSSRRTSAWLEKEGFAQSSTNIASSLSNLSSSQQRLEPSFDRMNKSEPQKEQKAAAKLQPAIDRVQLSKQKAASLAVRQPMNMASAVVHEPEKIAVISISNEKGETDKREDIDLLRASDIRAATKTTRTTKQEADEAKLEGRKQLEEDFERMQKTLPEETISDAKQLRAESNRLSTSIDNVWKHAERYPNGVVAKTMKSIGMVNEKFKEYVKPYNPGRPNLLEKLEFKTESLRSVPSIYKEQTSKPKLIGDETPKDALDEMQARKDLTESLRLSTVQAIEAKEKDDAQIEHLAKGIRQIYEAEHGPIDLSLAQNSTSSNTGAITDAGKQGDDKSSAPSKDFFAEQAEFMSEVDQLAQNFKLVKEKTAKFETDMNDKALTPAEISEIYKLLTEDAKSYAREAESLHMRYDSKTQPKQPHPLSTATVKPGVPRYPAFERYTQVFEPRFVQLLQDLKAVKRHLQEVSASLHDLKRSKVVEDASPKPASSAHTRDVKPSLPKVEAQNDAVSTSPSSPYLILVYNKTTGEVDQTAMGRLPWSLNEKVEKANPIRIMGNLNYPAAFVTHFVELEKAGYELTSGGGDMLIFQRTTQSATVAQNKAGEPVSPASEILRNTIAAEEASAQPEISETIAQPKINPTKQAATVLDEIPVEVPPPGPAAPTAPPSNPLKKIQKAGPKVRRQEQVFSGTIPLRPSSSKSQQSSQNKDQNSHTSSSSTDENTTEDPTFFARTTRTIKRGVLGVAAFGATAYTIGVVAEGIGAQAQVEGDAVTGPRTKVVMPVGQRPGIYSTESSRN